VLLSLQLVTDRFPAGGEDDDDMDDDSSLVLLMVLLLLVGKTTAGEEAEATAPSAGVSCRSCDSPPRFDDLSSLVDVDVGKDDADREGSLNEDSKEDWRD